MRRIGFVALVGLSALLAGPAVAQQTKAEKRLAADQKRCASFGYEFGTDAFANCMMKMHSIREQKKAAECQEVKDEIKNRQHSGGFSQGLLDGFRTNQACKD